MDKETILKMLLEFRTQQSNNHKTSDIILLAAEVIALYDEDTTIQEDIFYSIMKTLKINLEKI